MRFKDYLQESQYRTEIEAEQAWNLMNKHCKDALKNIETPIVRGARGQAAGFSILHGEAGSRKSRNTSNHYTVILDSVLPSEYPKRSGSIICATWSNRQHAMAFGTLFAIIPFDGVKIGVCPKFDMHETKIRIGGKSAMIHRWNSWLENQGVSESQSFDEMMKNLEEQRASDKPVADWLKKLKPGTIKETFEAAYTKPFTLATTAESEKYDQDHEVWIGGKCLAIDLRIYQNMMKNPDPNAVYMPYTPRAWPAWPPESAS